MGKSLSIIAITIQIYHINNVDSKMNYREEPMADDYPLPPGLEHLRHRFYRKVPVQPDNPQRTSRNLLMESRHRHTNPNGDSADGVVRFRHNPRTGFHTRITANDGWDHFDASDSHRLGGGGGDTSDPFARRRTDHSHSGVGHSGGGGSEYTGSSHTADADTSSSAFANARRTDGGTHAFDRRTIEDSAASTRHIPPKSTHVTELTEDITSDTVGAFGSKGKGKGKGGPKPHFAFDDDTFGAFGGSSVSMPMYGRHSQAASAIKDFVHGTGFKAGSEQSGSGQSGSGFKGYPSFPNMAGKTAADFNEYAPTKRAIPIDLKFATTNDHPYSEDSTADYSVAYHAMGGDIFDQSKGLLPDSEFEQANTGVYFPFFFSRVGNSAQGACRARANALQKGQAKAHGPQIIQAIYVHEYNEWARQSGSNWPQLSVMKVDAGFHLVPKETAVSRMTHIPIQHGQTGERPKVQDFQIPPIFVEMAFVPIEQLKTIRSDQIQFERQQIPAPIQTGS